MEQVSLFNDLLNDFKLTKPIKLIECFAGYGSQALALKYLGVDFTHHRICEWAIKSIQAYKDIHFTNDNTDYSQLCTKEQLIDYLFKKGISANYNEPMTYEQIKRLSESQLRTIYNNIITTKNLVNITQVKAKDLDITNKEDFTYLLTYSFPCQDLSLAGKGKGMKRDSGTRSGMLWQIERILKECQDLNTLPDILLMENVPQVIGTKNIKDFQEWELFLESLGYSNYVEILNAKDYGVPQNRERAFMISILGDYKYEFPKPIKLKLRLKDILEDNVDESYFLSDKMIKYICSSNLKWTGNNNYSIINKQIASTINTGEGSKRCDASNYICDTFPENYDLKNLDIGGVVQDNRNDKEKFCDELLEKNMVKEGDVINHAYCKSRQDSFHIENSDNPDCFGTLTTRPDTLGIVVKDEYIGCYQYSKSDKFMGNKNRYTENKEIADTLLTAPKEGIVLKKDTPNYIEWEQKGRLDIDCRAWKENAIAPTTTTTPHNKVLLSNLRIRKLTPKECGRLMGVKDEDIDKLTLSKSAQYHCFGDSIVVDVLMEIFKQLL